MRPDRPTPPTRPLPTASSRVRSPPVGSDVRHCTVDRTPAVRSVNSYIRPSGTAVVRHPRTTATPVTSQSSTSESLGARRSTSVSSASCGGIRGRSVRLAYRPRVGAREVTASFSVLAGSTSVLRRGRWPVGSASMAGARRETIGDEIAAPCVSRSGAVT